MKHITYEFEETNLVQTESFGSYAPLSDFSFGLRNETRC